MKRILLVGAGQLGARHLQALAKLQEPARFEVVDPSSASIENAARIFSENLSPDSPHEIAGHGSLHSTPTREFDLAVVATNADVRLDVVRMLAKDFDVGAMILEKVLFQSESEFDEAERLLAGRKAWVNCPRRMFPAYRTLHNLRAFVSPTKFRYTGGAWGLGCNGIHIVDIVNFLTGAVPTKVDTSGLERKAFEARRPGYSEYFGEILIEFRGGHSLSLICTPETAPTNLAFVNSESCGDVREGLGQVSIRIADRDHEFPFTPIFQSGLTNLCAEDIFLTGDSELTPFTVSAQLHRPFVRALAEFHSDVTGRPTERAPIT